MSSSSARGPALVAPEPYDFTAPRRLAQAQLRVLAAVHKAFAQAFALALSSHLRTLVDVEPGEPDVTPYAEFVATTPAPAALFVATAAHGHRFALDLDVRLAAFLVERLFGGGGSIPLKGRPLTAVEQHVAGKIATNAVVDLAAAWARAGTMAPSAPWFESSAEFAHIATPSDQMLTAPFTVRLMETASSVRLVYPLHLLEALLDRPALHRWSTGGEVPVSDPVRAGFEARLSTLPVELRAELGRTRLRLFELDALAEGDVIPLGQKATAPVSVHVRGREAFRAAAGRSGDRLALQILHAVDSPLSA